MRSNPLNEYLNDVSSAIEEAVNAIRLEFEDADEKIDAALNKMRNHLHFDEVDFMQGSVVSFKNDINKAKLKSGVKIVANDIANDWFEWAPQAIADRRELFVIEIADDLVTEAQKIYWENKYDLDAIVAKMHKNLASDVNKREVTATALKNFLDHSLDTFGKSYQEIAQNACEHFFDVAQNTTYTQSEFVDAVFDTTEDNIKKIIDLDGSPEYQKQYMLKILNTFVQNDLFCGVNEGFAVVELESVKEQYTHQDNTAEIIARQLINDFVTSFELKKGGKQYKPEEVNKKIAEIEAVRALEAVEASIPASPVVSTSSSPSSPLVTQNIDQPQAPDDDNMPSSLNAFMSSVYNNKLQIMSATCGFALAVYEYKNDFKMTGKLLDVIKSVYSKCAEMLSDKVSFLSK